MTSSDDDPGDPDPQPPAGIPGLPAGFENLIGQLPQQVQDQLAQVPPEAMEQLQAQMPQAPPQRPPQAPAAFGVDVSKLTEALGGQTVDPQQVLDSLPADLVAGIHPSQVHVEQSQPMTFTSMQIVGGGGGSQRMQARFTRDEHRAGDVVEGVLVALQPLKAKELLVELSYVDQSPQFQEHTVHDSFATNHKGKLEAGTEIPFRLQLPTDALPPWGPATFGRMYWAVTATATRRGMVAHDVDHLEIPASQDPAAWPGPQPGEPAPVRGAGKDGDVHVEVQPRAPRRGSTVRVDVVADQPAPGRTLQVGLLCEAHFDIESKDNDGHRRRRTRLANVVEDWTAVDLSSPLQQVQLAVPAGVPFSHGKGSAKSVGPFTMSKTGPRRDHALAIEWKVVVREDRRLRRDPKVEVPLQVLP